MNKQITDILSSIGIKNVGFCDFADVRDHLLDCRAKSRLPQNAKTIIMCVFPYKVIEESPEFLSRYAAVPDYHVICGQKLSAACENLKEKYPQNNFEWFCDNSPIPEVHTAATASLGVKGDNGLLITKEFGSFVFLGEIVTDLELDCAKSYAECAHCGICQKTCPVKMDKKDCLSNLSQKKKLDQSELEILRKNKILWGCDICQNACPMNNGAKCTDITEFIDGYRNIYALGEDTACRPYTWRGEEVIKRNFENLVKLPRRKAMRLKNYDYNTQGAYFITICTQNRKEILSDIVVGTGVLDCPKTVLSNYGKIADSNINEMSNFYDNLSVDKYVIMPNHIHLLISVKNFEHGQSGTPVPTNANSVVSRFVSTFKRLCNKEYKKNIWQPRFHDHIIRGEEDYKEIWEYIDTNPQKWRDDEFYVE